MSCPMKTYIKRSTLPLTLATILMPLAAGTAIAATDNGAKDVEKLRDHVLLQDQYAWDIVEGLTTEIGPRLGGTPAEARARLWAVERLNKLGFANVRQEEFRMPTWVRGEEKAEIISPFPQKLAVTALGNSGSTGDTGIEAEIVYLPTFADLAAAEEGSLKGKIAFVSHAMHATQDGSSYGAFGPVRFVGPNLASKKGAEAIIIRSVGTDYHRNPHTGNSNFEDGVKHIPAAAISIPDAENLERMLARGKPVKLKLTLTPKNIGEQTSGNVIAEVKGSRPDLPIIVIACHLDSWDLGTGAVDDGAGCAIISAAAKHVMENGAPKRTIRLLWAGAEEVGVHGGKAYAEKHKDTPHAVAMESDFGADRVWQVNFNLPKSASSLADEIAASLAPLGIGRGRKEAGEGADIGAIVAAQKLAVVDLSQDGTRYFSLHHTPDDTLDKIDPEQLRQNVAAWTSALMLLSRYEGDLSPE